MPSYTLTENMKMWLKDLYLHEAEEHRIVASNYHLWALGSKTQEDAIMYETYAEENKEFANILEIMAKQMED